MNRSVFEQINDQTDILELVQQYVSLEKRGKNYFGLCPFHDEKTPSFSVSPEKNIAVCMGCGKGGKPITFYQQIKNISFIEAARELGMKLGIKVETKPVDTKYQLEHQILKVAHEFFKFALYNTEEGIKAFEYLKKRGFNEEVIKHFEIGLATSDFQNLAKFLIDNEYDPKVLLQLGLITQSQKDNEYYDFFKNRVIFPIKNEQLDIVGFSGRTLDLNEEVKYLNSIDSPVFKKSEVVYHLFEDEVIKEKNEMLLFEGFFDVISAYQHGFKNGVATMGTALTDQQARLMRKSANNIIIAYDGDQAGLQAARLAIPKLKKARFNVNILTIPNAQDPDDYLKNHGADGFSQLLSEHVIDSYRYYYNELILRLDPNNANSVSVFQKEANHLFKTASSIVKKMFEKEISEKLGFEFSFTDQPLDTKPLPAAKKEPIQKIDRFVNSEIDIIVELILRKNNLELVLKELVLTNSYVDLKSFEIIKELSRYYDQRDKVSISEFKLLLEPTKREWLEKVMLNNFNWSQGITLSEEEIKKRIEFIKHYDQIRLEQSLIAQIDSDADEVEQLKKLQEYMELKRKNQKKGRR